MFDARDCPGDIVLAATGSFPPCVYAVDRGRRTAHHGRARRRGRNQHDSRSPSRRLDTSLRSNPCARYPSSKGVARPSSDRSCWRSNRHRQSRIRSSNSLATPGGAHRRPACAGDRGEDDRVAPLAGTGTRWAAGSRPIQAIHMTRRRHQRRHPRVHPQITIGGRRGAYRACRPSTETGRCRRWPYASWGMQDR